MAVFDRMRTRRQRRRSKQTGGGGVSSSSSVATAPPIAITYRKRGDNIRGLNSAIPPAGYPAPPITPPNISSIRRPLAPPLDTPAMRAGGYSGPMVPQMTNDDIGTINALAAQGKFQEASEYGSPDTDARWGKIDAEWNKQHPSDPSSTILRASRQPSPQLPMGGFQGVFSTNQNTPAMIQGSRRRYGGMSPGVGRPESPGLYTTQTPATPDQISQAFGGPIQYAPGATRAQSGVAQARTLPTQSAYGSASGRGGLGGVRAASGSPSIPASAIMGTPLSTATGFPSIPDEDILGTPRRTPVETPVESPESSFRRRLMRSRAEADVAQQAGLPFTSTNVNMENIQDPTMRGVLASRASMRPQVAPTREYGGVAPNDIQGIKRIAGRAPSQLQSGFRRSPGGGGNFGPAMWLGTDTGGPIDQSVTPVVGGEGLGRTIDRNGEVLPEGYTASIEERRAGRSAFKNYMENRAVERPELAENIAANSAAFDRQRGGSPTLSSPEIAANVQKQAQLRKERGMGPQAFATMQRRQEQMRQMQQQGLQRAAMGGNRFAQQSILGQQKWNQEEPWRRMEFNQQQRRLDQEDDWRRKTFERDESRFSQERQDMEGQFWLQARNDASDALIAGGNPNPSDAAVDVEAGKVFRQQFGRDYAHGSPTAVPPQSPGVSSPTVPDSNSVTSPPKAMSGGLLTKEEDRQLDEAVAASGPQGTGQTAVQSAIAHLQRKVVPNDEIRRILSAKGLFNQLTREDRAAIGMPPVERPDVGYW